MWDYIWGTFFLVSIIVGLARGLIKEGLAIALWILIVSMAAQGAMFFCKQSYFQWLHADIRWVATFTMCLILGWLCGLLVQSIYHLFFGSIQPAPLNRFLGGVFGAVRGVLLIVLVMALVDRTPYAEVSAWKNSVIFEKLQPVRQALHRWTPEQLQQKSAPLSAEVLKHFAALAFYLD